MSTERLTEVQDSISEALDRIPVEGPQVRFAKCTHKPGYLVMMCVDRTSADWLKEVIPTIKPWEGATLTVLGGGNTYLKPTPALPSFLMREGKSQRRKNFCTGSKSQIMG
ncbi:unnamed protein product [Phaedon cochleariae]|uniref:DUF4780 domain-containing protein n=1 Tax=Phaedon cochleariae TaxID=80249 RepID=A0A9N9S8Y7_PHACE|nr:unnamed protein product [Phaedon cochleariae]